MKTLLILRHGKAEHRDSKGDKLRDLTDEGVNEAAWTGAEITRRGIAPQLILSSSALRANRTAQTVAARCAYGGAIIRKDELYSGAVKAYRDALLGADGAATEAGAHEEPRTLLLVGHNPAVQDLVQALSGVDLPMSPGDLVVLTLPGDSWGDLSGAEVREVIRPEG